MVNHYQFPNSSILASCSYDTTEQTLTVEFTNGRSYTYKDIPVELYNELIGAKSAGSYFNSVKKGLELK